MNKVDRMDRHQQRFGFSACVILCCIIARNLGIEGSRTGFEM